MKKIKIKRLLLRDSHAPSWLSGPETDVLTEPPLIDPGPNNVIWTHTAAIRPMAVPGGGQRLDVHDNLSMKICNKSKDA
jgi:hypothetical protein